MDSVKQFILTLIETINTNINLNQPTLWLIGGLFITTLIVWIYRMIWTLIYYLGGLIIIVSIGSWIYSHPEQILLEINRFKPAELFVIGGLILSILFMTILLFRKRKTHVDRFIHDRYPEIIDHHHLIASLVKDLIRAEKEIEYLRNLHVIEKNKEKHHN